MRLRRVSQGFALPTVIISALVLFAVLVAAMGNVSSARTTLDAQYYESLARDAAESGLAMARACLAKNFSVPQWTTQPLVPNAGCGGGVACTNQASCFLVSIGNVHARFTVAQPVDNGDGAQVATATGIVELVRSSNGATYTTYTKVSKLVLGSALSFNSLALGYLVDAGAFQGAFYGVITSDHKLLTAGLNSYGQLGHAGVPAGIGVNSTTPSSFQLPGAIYPLSVYSNFFSQGYNMFTLGSDKQIYGVGRNVSGQLGNGSTSTTDTPQKFQLPGAKTARFVYSNGFGTFVITTDNLLYSTGECTAGELGTNYTVAGCALQSTPQQVALPGGDTVNSTLDPNVVIGSDRPAVLVIGQSGKVYSWGEATQGTLGDGTFVSRSNPVQIGTFGNAGNPKAIAVMQASSVSAVLGDDGTIMTSGSNGFGEQGYQVLKFQRSGSCVTSDGTGTTVVIGACDINSTMQNFLYRSDYTLQNVSTGKCLVTTTGTNLVLTACPATPQPSDKWSLGYVSAQIQSTGYSMYTTNGTALGLTSTMINEFWVAYPKLAQYDYNAAGVTGKAVKMVGDEYTLTILTDQGEVWSVGLNQNGKFGNGGTATRNTVPTKFILPNDVKAVDLSDTGTSAGVIIRDLMVVGSDGKVYGAGTNDYGQLGTGNTTQYSTPQPMLNITNAISVRTGGGTTIVIGADKSVWAVGNNNVGQLGDGTTVNKSTPVKTQYLNNLTPAYY